MDMEPTDYQLYMLSEATHLMGHTGLYILKWLMVNFMLCGFYFKSFKKEVEKNEK